MENLDIITTKTYSVTLLTVSQLSELMRITGKKQSELVRDAVDELYNKIVNAKGNGHES